MSPTGLRGVFVRMPDELHYAIKVEAARQRQALAEWIEEAVRAKLAGTCPCDEAPTPAGE